MQVATSLELVLQLAAREAAAARFSEIEPEHLLMGTLKFAELPADELGDREGQDAGVAQLLGDIEPIRQFLAKRKLDGTQVRRRLRSRLGQGERAPNDDGLRRSAACKQLFTSAARQAGEAGETAVSPVHLLEAISASPTPLIQEVLGADQAGSPDGSGDTPLLDQHARDLTGLAARSELPEASGRQPEARAMARILASGPRKSLVAVAETPTAGESSLHALARLMKTDECPSALNDRRLIELEEPFTGIHPPAEALALLQNLLTEAAETEGVIVAVRLDRAADSGDRGLFHELITTAVEETSSPLLVLLAPGADEDLSSAGRAWKRRAHLMRLYEERANAIPRQL